MPSRPRPAGNDLDTASKSSGPMLGTSASAATSTGPRCMVPGRRALSACGNWSAPALCLNPAYTERSGNRRLLLRVLADPQARHVGGVDADRTLRAVLREPGETG